MSRQEILSTIDKWVLECSGWVINRIDSHYINVTLYKPLNSSSYIELPMELRNPKKGLINITRTKMMNALDAATLDTQTHKLNTLRELRKVTFK